MTDIYKMFIFMKIYLKLCHLEYENSIVSFDIKITKKNSLFNKTLQKNAFANVGNLQLFWNGINQGKNKMLIILGAMHVMWYGRSKRISEEGEREKKKNKKK